MLKTVLNRKMCHENKTMVISFRPKIINGSSIFVGSKVINIAFVAGFIYGSILICIQVTELLN